MLYDVGLSGGSGVETWSALGEEGSKPQLISSLITKNQTKTTIDTTSLAKFHVAYSAPP